MSKVSLLGKRGFSEGQATAQRFFELVDKRCGKVKVLGKSPLHVADYAKGIRIRVDDPLREDPVWMDPEDDVEEVIDEASSNAIDDFVITHRFLNGELKLRPKIWIGDGEVKFLSNKPERRIITVRLGIDGDIVLQDNDGNPYVVTTGH